ncbi:MAG: hypothetical protein IPM69_05650 [Ignavibacteria bacterium]|nr:hypothetical protein [Ignavibacteria bacterium]
MNSTLILYNVLIIQPLRLFVFIYSFFSPKLRERENAYQSTLDVLSHLPKSTKSRVWFHAASMGEFEQAKPIIERLKSKHPDIIVIVSFFSPSGFRNQKNYPLADAVVYMPLDTHSNVREFLELVKPDVAVFIRYELWLNHLTILKDTGISTFLMCATFPGSKVWLYLPFRTILISILRTFTAIYTVSQAETKRFNTFASSLPVLTSGDTRFDRILSIVDNLHLKNDILPENYFTPDDFVLVVGSSWEKDEDMIIESIRNLDQKYPQIKLIIVPHEPSHEHVSKLIQKLPSAMVLSQISKDSPKGSYIITDSIGNLLRLYSYARAAFVGGGFGAGVHSTAEPAGYGIPVACGPFITRSPDAQNLYNNGALELITSPQECFRWLELLLTDTVEYNRRSKQAKDYVYQGKGASEILTERIMEALVESRSVVSR